VVEVYSDPSNLGPNGECLISGEGTNSMPIFVRGINMARINRTINLGYYGNAEYIIVENMNASGFGVVGRSSGVQFENNHVVLRHSDIGNQGGVEFASYNENMISNIVVYNVSIHERGIWDPDLAEGDKDLHCIAVGSKVSYLWVLDSQMYHCEGDGIQINSGDYGNDTRFIYVR
jgi:hypothetical protein